MIGNLFTAPMLSKNIRLPDKNAESKSWYILTTAVRPDISISEPP